MADSNVPKRPGTMAGDIKIWDANGDGEINSLDRIRQDLTDIPQIVYGVNLGITWKQFDLSLLFQGQAKVINTIQETWSILRLVEREISCNGGRRICGLLKIRMGRSLA